MLWYTLPYYLRIASWLRAAAAWPIAILAKCQEMGKAESPDLMGLILVYTKRPSSQKVITVAVLINAP